MIMRTHLHTSFPTRLIGAVCSVLALAMTTGTSAATASDFQAPAYGPGVEELMVRDDRTDRPLEGHIWYPTSTPGKMTRADKSKVWEMAPADPDGTLAEGVYPLIIVSHGTYGNTSNQAWLASELARRGYLVAAINHPGTSTWLRDADHARQIWERPRDLSRVITYLTEKSSYKHQIDRDRIHAVGHSLGGFTVMMLAGARFDPEYYRPMCAEDPNLIVCKVLQNWSVGVDPADDMQLSASYGDPRIASVISLDLGGTQTFSKESLAAITTPSLILGAERADMLDQNRESRALYAAMRKAVAVHVELEDAGHFDFMGVCKPDGYAILKEHEPGDEIVCVKGGVERQGQHQRILTETLTFLGH